MDTNAFYFQIQCETDIEPQKAVYFIPTFTATCKNRLGHM